MCSFNPYYNNQNNFPIDNVIKDIEELLKIVSKIYELNITGGEPFLNRDLDKLLKFLLNSEISTICILTTGTIIPSKSILKLLRNKKIFVRISDYGLDKQKIIELSEIFREEKIKYEILKNIMWVDLGDFNYRDVDKNQTKDIFTRCLGHFFANTIIDGKYFLCPRTAHAMNLGFLSGEIVFVDLREGEALEKKID